MFRFISADMLTKKFANAAFHYKGHRCWASKSYYGDSVGFDIYIEVEDGVVAQLDEINNDEAYEKFKKECEDFDEDRCIILSSIKFEGDEYKTLGEVKDWKPTMKEVLADGNNGWLITAAQDLKVLLDRIDFSRFSNDKVLATCNQRYLELENGKLQRYVYDEKSDFARGKGWVTYDFTCSDCICDMGVFFRAYDYWSQYVKDEWELICCANFGKGFDKKRDVIGEDDMHVGVVIDGKKILISRYMEYAIVPKDKDDKEWRGWYGRDSYFKYDTEEAERNFELAIVPEFPEDVKVIDYDLIDQIEEAKRKEREKARVCECEEGECIHSDVRECHESSN